MAIENMKTPLLISLALIVLTQISLGYTEETAAAAAEGADKQATADTETPSLSRAKRGGYDMMRLARGLHMLRLGKRDGGTSPDDEELLNFLQEYYQQYPDEPIFFDDGDVYPDNEVDVPAHPRFRRSAPGPDGVVPPPQLQDGSSDLKDNEESAVSAEGNEEPYLLYPEDDAYLYGDLDDLYQSLENGDVDENDGVELGKRQLSMLRLGKRSLGMLRLGKREDEEAEKRQLSMLRLGKRSLGMLRLGKRDFDEEEEKRNLGMLRLGKRPMSMLRLGKRPMSMLRLGKRPMSMLRLGKRPMSMLRLGKRPMSMLRLGKRPMSMLRLGKRPMSMLRLGKRPMSMLRLGKRQDEDLNETFNEEEKRSLGMLRLGKRPMSMLRLGKRPMSMLRLGKREDEEEEKRSLGMLRLGKRSAE